MARWEQQRSVTSAPNAEVGPSPSDKRTPVVPRARSAPGAGSVPDWIAKGVELDSSSAAAFVLLHGKIMTEVSRGQWHKIIILSPVLESEKRVVIAVINHQIAPHKLIPYFFSMENGCITFYVTNWGMELTTLCQQNLKVRYKFSMLEMKLKLFSKNFNMREVLKKIVSRRLDRQKKYLDLSNLISIPEFAEMLFDPNEKSHVVDQLLRVAEVIEPELVSLSLASNDLVALNSLWNLLHRSKWKSLRVLDLTDNKLKNTGSVFLSQTAPITELHLNGNPICGMCKTKDLYVSLLKAALPKLCKLDGTYLPTIPMPYWKPNFIMNGSCGDSGELADQFIEHFFTLYDKYDRMDLHGLYHKDAYFSVSSMSIGSQTTTPFARLACYCNKARNLLRRHRRERHTLTHGSGEILERISKLPATQHDRYSFTVDLLLHSRNLTVLTVTGIFCDIVQQKRAPRHFMRTFVLTGLRNNEYQIINDILYVTNTTTSEAEEAFRFAIPIKQVKNKSPQNVKRRQ